MRKINYLLLAMFLCIATISCVKTHTPQPTPPVSDDELTLEIINVDATSVHFRVMPINDELTYITMITLKEYYDQFESDDAYIEDDLMWFDDMAFEEGISYYDYIGRMLKTGVLEDTQDNLSPKTEYLLYAYGLSAKGEVLTEIFKQPFTTTSVEKSELNFKIEVSDIGHNDAIMRVEPENKDIFYFINVFSEEDYEYWGGNSSAYEQQLEYLREYYLNMGATIEQMIANLCFVGDKNIRLTDLKAGEKYYAYAIGVNEDFLANSEASVVEFETIAVEMSDLTFEVEFTDIRYDRVSCNITPSNNNDSYICSVQYAESLEWYDNNEDFIDSLISEFKHWNGGVENALHIGYYTINGTGLSPETEYILVCFGYDNAPTTELYIYPFTTPAATGNVENLEISFTISEITHNSSRITTDPSEGVYYFVSQIESAAFDNKVSELGSVDLAVIEFANADIDYGAEWFGCSRADYLYDVGAYLGIYTTPFTQLTPQTEYIAFAVAVDINTGEIASTRGYVSDRYTTLEKITSDALVTFHYGDYYDGSELAALDPARFLNCTGLVVMPYTIETNEHCDTWYTGLYNGDYTEWGATDDDVYAELITYGYEWNSDQVSVNSTGGVAVLSYDTAFTLLGMAEDSNGHFGHATIDVIRLSRDGASPAEEFLAQYPSAKPSRASIPQLKAGNSHKPAAHAVHIHKDAL